VGSRERERERERVDRTYQGVVLAVRGLGDKDGVRASGGLDKVMRAHISHDLCSWVDFRLKLLLQLSQGLFPAVR
jgi:hypothetical protein